VIEAVMLWNEPNNLSHWDRHQDPDWSLFAEMVCLAGQRLASVAPGLPRVLGGISPIDPTFVQSLFAQGVGPAIDVVAVHGFPLDWNRWHLSEWPARVQAIQDVSGGKPVWATEVGASSLVSPELQAWAVDATLEHLLPCAERVFWYALMDLPERWEAVTRHRGSEGSAYYRHFRMGVFDAEGRPKPAAARLAAAGHLGVGVCEWVYWQERERLECQLRLLEQLGIRRVRTGIGWADWDRPGAVEWFDEVMQQLAAFEVTLTLCFTPARAGRQPHHTSPPVNLHDFADFCEAIVRRYTNVLAVA
jgi:beta-xylosidase